MQAGLYCFLRVACYLQRKFFLAHSSIHFRLTKPLHSEAQRALGYNEFFEKLSPEAQDWVGNTVCVSIVLHLRFSLNGDVLVPEIS